VTIKGPLLSINRPKIVILQIQMSWNFVTLMLDVRCGKS